MRMRTSALMVLLAAGGLLAQGSNRYENPDLKLSFDGIYGWQATFATGSGGWAELARYREEALDATVRVLVTSNPYSNPGEMREAARKEFAEGGEPTEGAPVYKEIAVADVTMRRGAKLPGVEVQGYRVSIDEAGKKREDRIVARTWYAEDRLYRVLAEVRRSRANRVEDLLVRAMDSLTVEEGAVEGPRAFEIRSAAGRYAVAVPNGFLPVVPDKSEAEDLRFEKPRRNISVQIYAQAWDGGLEDQLDELFDEHGSDIRLESDEVRVLGEDGYLCRIERGDRVTIVSGTVKNQRSYRVETSFLSNREDEARADHAAFVSSIKLED